MSLLSRKNRRSFSITWLILAAAASALSCPLRAADGIFGIGAGARAVSMGGADVASPAGSLCAMAANPAGLSLLTAPEADTGFIGASAYGRFGAKTGEGGSLSDAFDLAPEAGISVPAPSIPLTIGFGVVPQTGLAAHWNYPDPPGGLGGTASYGQQRDHSEIEVIRFALGAGAAITRQLSIGGSFGIDYDENLLQTPYIFQSQQVLRGFKTLLDLSTSGWGVNGNAGILYRPVEVVAIGVDYQSRTTVSSYGNASGNAGAQLNALGPAFSGVRRDFHYDAEVDNTFPQIVSGGVAWKFHPGWEASAQVDWTGWSGAFNTLPVKLSHGDNAQINALVGSNALEDKTPLRWRDSFTYRFGIEDAITRSIFLRCGYSFSKSPVPDDTLTPLTAAIPESTLTAGAGYRWRWLEVDLAYEWDIPITRHVGTSALLDGEYSGSTVTAGIQWLGLTTLVRF
jgi:long-subunit fatty acid transport protein